MVEYLFGLTLYGLCLCFIAWTGWRGVHNDSDYVLGGRRLGWFVVAMSAGATGMSGWLMLGLPGETYRTGGTVMWLLLGLLLGIIGNWTLIAARLREASVEMGDALTMPVFLAARSGAKEGDSPLAVPSLVRRLSGIVVLVFLGLYTATGMVAGGKLFASVFGLEYQLGVMLIAGLVLMYSLMGGFLSISWSDVLQAVMMFLVLGVTAMLVWGAVSAPEMSSTLPSGQLADFLSPWRTEHGIAIGAVAIISSLSWGLGYFGQPHIHARFKAMRTASVRIKAFPLTLIWSMFCMLAAIVIGISARMQLTLPDPETALLHFIEVFYNPWIGGLALAAVLAAVMSTADSQLLVAATAVTHDLMDGERRRSLRMDRLALIGVAVAAMLLASNPESTVFGLVSYAWAGLGASFGPSVLLSLYWKPLTGAGILASVITGAVGVVAWDFVPVLAATGLYSLGPMFVLSFAVAVGASLLEPKLKR